MPTNSLIDLGICGTEIKKGLSNCVQATFDVHSRIYGSEHSLWNILNYDIVIKSCCFNIVLYDNKLSGLEIKIIYRSKFLPSTDIHLTTKGLCIVPWILKFTKLHSNIRAGHTVQKDTHSMNTTNAPQGNRTAPSPTVYAWVVPVWPLQWLHKSFLR